jgi:hypothetical protein
MKRSWPVVAGLGVFVTLLMVSVLVASRLDPVTSGRPVPQAAGSTTSGAIQAVTDRVDLPAEDVPTGFWYGTDSLPVTLTGTAPYREPGIGGAYGGYIGMAGSWSYWLHCPGGFLAWSAANSA